MAIYYGSKIITPYYGNYKPVNIYKGTRKYAGWLPDNKTGEIANFIKTYNDKLSGKVCGKTIQQADYLTKTGLTSQAGTPTPSVPIPLTQNVAAGAYKVSLADGIYEVAIPNDLRGIGTYLDRIVLDIISKKGWVENKVGEKIFDGTEAFGSYTTLTNTAGFIFSLPNGTGWNTYPGSLCSHFKRHYTVVEDLECFSAGDSGAKIYFRINKSKLATADTAGFKAWVLAQSNIETPLSVHYPLKAPTRTMLTFTKVSSSTAPELPVTAYTTTISPDTPYFLYDAGGNLISKTPQLLTNGNFANGTTGWYDSGTGTVTVANGVLSHKSNGAILNPYAQQITTFPVNHIIYARANVLVTNTVCQSIYIATNSQDFNILNAPLINTWYQLSGTILNNSGIRFRVHHRYVDAATSLDKVMQVKNMFCADLTEIFGAGNEPTVEWCDANLKWIDVASSTVVIPTSRGIQVAADAIDYTYIDASGNKWVADSLEYVGGGVWNKVQRIDRYEFTGNEPFMEVTNSFTNVSVYMLAPFYDTVHSYDKGICTHIPTLTSYTDTVGMIFGKDDNGIYFLMDKVKFPTDVALTDFMYASYDEGTPVAVEYMLDTPITTQVTLGELATYPQFTAVNQSDYSVAAYLDITAKVVDETV